MDLKKSTPAGYMNDYEGEGPVYYDGPEVDALIATLTHRAEQAEARAARREKQIEWALVGHAYATIDGALVVPKVENRVSAWKRIPTDRTLAGLLAAVDEASGIKP